MFPKSIELTHLLSTILSAAVIGCFSWSAVDDAYWLVAALWYGTLIMSIFAILLASSQAFIFSSLAPPSVGLGSAGDYTKYLDLILVVRDRQYVRRDREQIPAHQRLPQAKMLFTWQAPMMLMGYSVIFFVGGLTVYVCTPLFRGTIPSDDTKVSPSMLLSHLT